MKLAIARAEDEIKRLITLGFLDWEKDLNGVRVSQKNDDKDFKNVSFPKSLYTGNSLKRDDFWSRHRASVVIDSIRSMNKQVIWELGGGDGRVGLQLAEAEIGVISIEPVYDGCAKVAKMGLPVFSGKLQDLNLPNYSLPAVGFFDVLEHIEDDKEFLKYVHSKLASSGLIFLTVPAHKWLFSEHDIALGHFRRYGLAKLVKLINESGFEIIRADYLFSVLVPAAILLRRIPFLLKKKRGVEFVLKNSEQVLQVSSIIDKLLKIIFRLERKTRFPFGLSIFAVAKKMEK